MAETESNTLRETVLHDWHAANGGKMVAFGGWDMPVQYKDGIIREHLATRRHAGLFDVSHMGRFEIAGKHAEAFALAVLTNNARALEPQQAQYTFIATDTGGAVDDAYLYKLAEQKFLLVVNAANRDKDWDWLQRHQPAGEATLTDLSENLGMIALQGPQSASILEQVVAPEDLPEHKRNRMSVASFEGTEVIVARTGYTGESVCFELFAPRAQTVTLWERLVGLGAVPVGLGARDSLRLEAGLPLYGHELGTDPEGDEIPVFANPIAKFAVRPANGGDYVGREALERQAEEFVQINRDELDTPWQKRILKYIARPIAVFGGRRPLRAGFRVLYEGERAGYVTSGTVVPYTRFHAPSVTGKPTPDHELRPIGLALVRSDLRYRTDRPVVLQVVDERGRGFDAELVERNLWPSAPYARPYTGFRAPRRNVFVESDAAEDLAARLKDEAAANTAWRRRECVNLIPSENAHSDFVDALTVEDPAGRYNEHSRLKALGPDAPDVCYYKGTQFIMDKEEELKAALRTFFSCSQVEARVISGQMANDTVYDALKQFRNRQQRGRTPRLLGPVLVHDLNKGGHLSAQYLGALRNYVAIDPDTHRPMVEHFPFRKDDPYQIDVEKTQELIHRARPELIIFGRSVIIHREPVREIAEFVRQDFDHDDPRRPLIMYDGAHVLGLIGPHFQDPLAEGADVVTGSTHKTFLGPQRGVIMSNIGPGSAFEELWGFIETRAFPGHVSNHHLGTLLGLLGASYEMLQFKDEYPKRVIENAKAFATGLADAGCAVEGDAGYDHTETHQVLMRSARFHGGEISDAFEENNVITNPQAFYDDPSFAAASGVRMGTQEMTRYGMGPDDFRELAALLAEIARDHGSKPEGHWRDTVTAFRGRFTEMRYCL